MELQKIIKYVNKWVAFDSKRENVLASDIDVVKLDKKVKRLHIKDVIYTFILPPDKSYSP